MHRPIGSSLPSDGSLHRDVEVEKIVRTCKAVRARSAIGNRDTVRRRSSGFLKLKNAQNSGSRHSLFNATLEAPMKFSSPFLRKTTTLAPCVLAFAWLAVGCSSSDATTSNPPPVPPMPEASTPESDGAVPPPPELDAGSLMCGTNSCSSRFVGSSLGLACCARNGMSCGLSFNGGTCIDQSDAGFGMPPPNDAGAVVPDPTCGTVSVDVQGMTYPLSGCCLPTGVCGWYPAAMASIGCLSADQLRGAGAAVPDAPMACSVDAGPQP